MKVAPGGRLTMRATHGTGPNRVNPRATVGRRCVVQDGSTLALYVCRCGRYTDRVRGPCSWCEHDARLAHGA